MRRTAAALWRHIVIESFVRVISRESHRRVVREMERLRPGSFPFVSADTFRSLADVVIEGSGVTRRARQTKRSIIYFDVSQLSGVNESQQNQARLGILDSIIDRCAEKPVLILHNGDILPGKLVLERLFESCHHTFATNLLPDGPRSNAIPVGIENAYRNSNGRLEDFIHFHDGEIRPAKTKLIFSSFNIANNPKIRQPLADALSASPFGFSSRRISPKNHRRLTKEAKFVLSPPGNGVDCHRTWEAVYLGAVPVVLADYISAELIRDLPILGVASFDKFLEKSESALDQEYAKIRKVGVEKAFMPFWVSEVWRRSNEL